MRPLAVAALWLVVTANVGAAGAAPSASQKPAASAPADGEVPPADGEVPPADARRILGVFDRVADVMIAHRASCPRLAAELGALVAREQRAIRRAAAARAGGRRLPRATQERMLARVADVLPALRNCGHDPRVRLALQRLDGQPRGRAVARGPARRPAARTTARR